MYLFLSLPLDRESPNSTPEHPKPRPGEGPRHGGDVPGELGVGEALRGELQQLREDGQGQVEELHGQQQQECGEVSYLQENVVR